MKALMITAPGKLEIVEAPKPKAGTGQVVVKLLAAGLNRRDQWIREGKYPEIKMNTILGSDGCGTVVEVHDDEHRDWVGKEVIINPNINWGMNPAVQGRDYHILGMPTHGTFAEYVLTTPDRLVEKPGHLSAAHAAAVPMGGLTAYRALFTKGDLKPNDNVLISGFGGGVMQFAFQFAMAAGANVYITSGNPAKIKKAVALGAKAGFNYNEPNWTRELWVTKGGFDLVIDSAGGNQFNTFIKTLKPAGRIVFYGATTGLPANIDLYRMFWNQVTLQGSTMGNDDEFLRMLAFMEANNIDPLIDSVRPFEEILDAFDEIGNDHRIGKLVVTF
jgi:zinc-binding alcohol dehydrogenase/oxidoreductase